MFVIGVDLQVFVDTTKELKNEEGGGLIFWIIFYFLWLFDCAVVLVVEGGSNVALGWLFPVSTVPATVVLVFLIQYWYCNKYFYCITYCMYVVHRTNYSHCSTVAPNNNTCSDMGYEQ